MMNKIRVLHFIHSLVSGGAEKQLNILCNGMDKNRFDVAIFCVKNDGHDIQDDRVIIYSKFRAKLLRIDFFLSIYSCIKKFKPDVIHVWLPPSVTIPAMLVGKLAGLPVILSYRSRMMFLRPLMYIEFIVAVLCTTRIISNRAVDDSVRAFRWLYRMKRGRVIDNAVLVPQGFHRTNRHGNDSVRFLFVGRLTASKNLVRLIRAFSQIRNNEECILDIYGIGEQSAEIKSLIQDLNLTERVFMRGYCHNIYSEMAVSDALVFPSLFEGMPNVLVEALQIGLPVLASDISANRSVIGNINAVIWIDPENVEHMSKKIDEFFERKDELDEMTNNGIRLASHYTVDAMVNKYQDSYREIAKWKE